MEDNQPSTRRPSQETLQDSHPGQAEWPNNIVTWDSPSDPANPRNWRKKEKIRVTALISITTAGASFASSSFSPTFDQISEEFGVSTEVATLTLSLYVLGFAFGPLLFAPISELYGRKISVLPGYFACGLFLIAVATAENLQTVMLCRFFSGLMASGPISNTAGSIADMWNDHDRALAVVGYAIAVCGGPTIGPVIGAAVTSSYLGWRWTEYITAIFIFFILILDIFFQPGTYAPVLLERKAHSLRLSTGNWALHAKSEEKKLDKAHDEGKKNDPEARLPPMLLGAILFAAGLFMFGGGSAVEKSPAIGIVGIGMVGAGFILIFQNATNYLIDAFTTHEASAQAANTFLRSLAGAGFPLFATPMFKNLGVNWASYTLGFISVAMIPIPAMFYLFGKRLRGMSRYNPDHGTELLKKRSKEKGEHNV